jgi:hypothetical protein
LALSCVTRIGSLQDWAVQFLLLLFSKRQSNILSTISGWLEKENIISPSLRNCDILFELHALRRCCCFSFRPWSRYYFLLRWLLLPSLSESDVSKNTFCLNWFLNTWLLGLIYISLSSDFLLGGGSIWYDCLLVQLYDCVEVCTVGLVDWLKILYAKFSTTRYGLALCCFGCNLLWNFCFVGWSSTLSVSYTYACIFGRRTFFKFVKKKLWNAQLLEFFLVWRFVDWCTHFSRWSCLQNMICNWRLHHLVNHVVESLPLIDFASKSHRFSKLALKMNWTGQIAIRHTFRAILPVITSYFELRTEKCW